MLRERKARVRSWPDEWHRFEGRRNFAYSARTRLLSVAYIAHRAQRGAADPGAQRLTTVPGIGPVTALAYRATLDAVARFARPGQVAA